MRASLLVLIAACSASPSPPSPPMRPPVVTPAADAATVEQRLALQRIESNEDGRVVPRALGVHAGSLTLFTDGPTGLVRRSIDLAAGRLGAPASTVLATVRTSATVAFDNRDGELWWTAPGETFQIPDRNVGRIVTVSHFVGKSGGTSRELRVCPATVLGTDRTRCDHTISTAVAVGDRLIVGGRLYSPPALGPWLGAIERDGTLARQHTICPDCGADARIIGLHGGPSGVLAVGTIGSAAGNRIWTAVVGGDLAAKQSPWLPQASGAKRGDWHAAMPRPEGGWWIAYPSSEIALRLLAIDANGAYVADHTIAQLSLPSAASAELFADDGRTWLVVAEHSYGGPDKKLQLWQLDLEHGRATRRGTAELPDGLWVHAIAASQRRVVLAGRIKTDRPLVLWFALPP